MGEQMESTGFIIGLDLGQAKDFTALCVLERVVPPREPRPVWEPPPPPVYVGNYRRGWDDTRTEFAPGGFSSVTGEPRHGVDVVYLPPADTRRATYHIRYLERLPLGTSYPRVVERVKEMLNTAPLSTKTPLVLDRTGIGAAISDMFEAAGLAPYAITITAGDQMSREGRQFRVPKRDLVGVLVMLFQSDRLKIAAGLAEGPTLVSELTNFKLKINVATGNDSYEAWRESIHDDLVLAVAMACWFGERQ